MKNIISLIILMISAIGLHSQSMVSYSVEVSGLCGMCKDRIETTAIEKGLAETASWDADTQLLSVEIDEEKTSISRVRYEVSLAGHDSGKFIAPDEVYNELPGCCQYRPGGSATEDHDDHDGEADADKDQLTEYEFRVEGICGMCQQRIENVAMKEGKASFAEWDIDTRMLTVKIDEEKTSVEKLRSALAEAGHENGSYKPTQEAYDNLHACCKYNDADVIAAHEPKDIHTDEDESHITDGYVMAKDSDGDLFPLIGATITLGDGNVGTTTNFEGYFALENPEHISQMTISYIGFETQTLELKEHKLATIILADGVQLQTVEISYKKRTTQVSLISTINSEKITRDELCKAACCNLSESFETNPSVDVSFNDAVTGTTQIQMLGLAGPYVQINRELMPDIRAMNNTLGLNMTPGPWIESIQLIKGPGSVVNGFESIAGQINVELKKPHKGEVLHVNGYANNAGRLEMNANARTEVMDKVSTNVLIHAKTMQGVHDNNGDGFTDMPREKDYIFVNRWNLEQTKDFQAQLGVKIASFDHSGGSHDHFAGTSDEHDEHWQMYNKTDRMELWGKLGYIFPDKPQQSLGLQWSILDHEQNGDFGNRFYDNNQQSLYANLIYQNIFDNGHILRGGLSYQLDDIAERAAIAGVYDRRESVPGAYMEYNLKKDEKWSLIPGIRVDHHNNYGTFVTPRLHAKYNFTDRSIFRLIAGRGLRTANIFADNMSMFATSRLADIHSTTEGNPYGLDPEVAWNYGINYTQAFDVSDKELLFSLDLFRTDFENQIVADFEDPRKVSFYNLDGKSYSNSFQAKIDYELFEGFDVRVAYRIFDVKTTYDGELKEKPYVSKHRAFANFAYKTKSDWHFDGTFNWRGSKRLPSTQANPEQYRRPDYSPDYVIVNAQVMKRWNDVFDVYVGAENLLNYKQEDAIIAGDDPFGEYFDASIVYAPLFGANIYIGFRYNLVKD